MKKASTLLLLFMLACLYSQAQTLPTANNVTLPAQANPGTYLIIPASAFPGTPPGNFTTVVLTKFPEGVQSLRITNGNTVNTFMQENFPAQGIYIPSTPAGQPTYIIEILPKSAAPLATIYFVIFKNNNPGSTATPEACLYVPFIYSPLPVNISRFTAEAEGGTTLLEWATSSEQNISGFEVQWSTNATEWKAIESISGRGMESSYKMVHGTPAQGINYYRLRSIGLDGTSEFSQVTRVIHQRAGVAIAIKPNPVRDMLHIESNENSIASLIDLTGREVARMQISGNATLNVQHLNPGYYQLTIRNASGSVLAQERVLKQ